MGPASILITGASRGLGLEYVKHILRQPSPPQFLIATCRDPANAKELQALVKEHERLKILKMDVTKDHEIEEAAQEAKRILEDKGLNLLINNAGINQKGDGGTLETQTRERLVSHFDTNVAAPVIIVKQFLPLLKQGAQANASLPVGCSRAAIINVSSIMSSIGKVNSASHFNAQHYRISKAALNMVTATLSNELCPEFKILVAAIHPGWVKTDMGGPSADLEKNVSIDRCWATILSLTESSTGMLFNYDGSVIPW